MSEPPSDPSGLTREYSTDRITVQWYAGRCIHSGNCVRALARVFDPKRRPWIDVSAAEAGAVEDAVRKCPSGALQFVRHDAAPEWREPDATA
jgi:uncharacterized Fe-S cluster protein YjdI